MLIFSIFLIGIALIIIGFCIEYKLNLKQWISVIFMIIGLVTVILSLISALIWW